MKAPPKPKKKVKQKLTQKEKFLEYARQADADVSGDTFEKALKQIVPPKD